MSKDNIGCAIMAIVVFSIMGTALYLIHRQDKIETEKKAMIEAASTGLDEYIIVDRKRCAHTRECFQLICNDSLLYAVKRIDTLTITDGDYDYVCVNCIGNKEYKHLKRISERNTIINYKPKETDR